MRRWIDRAHAQRSRPVGWVLALCAGIFLLTALGDVAVGDAVALSRFLGSIGFLLGAVAQLRTSVQPTAFATMTLAGGALLVISAALSFAIGFS